MSKPPANFRQILSGDDRSATSALTRAGLALLEPIYASVIGTRNALYTAGLFPAHSLGRPTIAVGNITTGGSGKTPAVRWLVEKMLAAGRHPAVLMRGYARPRGGISDEQILLQQWLGNSQVPIIASPDRVASAKRALAENPAIDLFILDDALQHRRAKRDVNLVVINALEPFGYGHLLPRGLLREPLSGLKRADAFLLTHASQVSTDEIKRIESQIRRYSAAPIFKADHIQTGLTNSAGESAEMSMLRDSRYFAFCGIGSPEGFFSSLADFGGQLAGSRVFPDHHDYQLADLDQLRAEADRLKAIMLLTTEKDWVKIAGFSKPGDGPAKIWRVSLALRFHEDDESKLLQLTSGKIHLP